jgi:DNA-binding transcriptional regulator GbsR (MarR family)
MNGKLDIESILASVRAEHEAKEIDKKKDGLTKIAKKISGDYVTKEAEEAQEVAKGVEDDIGRDLELSQELEKIASEMSDAESTEDIVKIAEKYGNSDIGNLAVLARSIADVVVEDIQSRLDK